MKKLLMVLMAALALAACGDGTPKAESGKQTIKIGTIFPLSGNMAHVGKSLSGAVEVAVSDANKNPDNKYFYKAVGEDSMLNMAKSAAIASKLVSVDKADALISFSADIGNAVNPVAESSKIIHFAMSVDPSGAKGKYNFINWTMPESSTSKMARIIQEKGFENVAIISFNQSGALANSEMLKGKLDAAGIKNSLHKFNGDIRDFRMDIEKIDAAAADLYVLRLFEPQMSIFIKQLRERNVPAQTTSIELFGLVEDKSAIQGLWYVDIAGEDREKLAEIKAFNKSAQDYGLAMAYDDVMLVVSAFEGAPDKSAAVDALAAIKAYRGVAGQILQKENGIFDSEATLRIAGER